MLLYIHNLPPNISYRDIDNLITTKCGISSVILNNLVSEGSGLKVTVGLVDQADAAIVTRHLNGFFLDGYQLFVEDVQKNVMSDQPYKSSQYLNSSSSYDRNHPSNKFNESYKTSSAEMPFSNSNLQETIYYNPPTHDASKIPMDQKTHLLSQDQIFDSSLNYLEKNSGQQQISQYEHRNIVPSTNYNYHNYSRDSDMSSGNSDHYYNLGSSQNNMTRFCQANPMNNSYVPEEKRLSDTYISSHCNSATPKAINHDEYARRDNPYIMDNKDSHLGSGNWKRRGSPSSIQKYNNKHLRKDPPGVFQDDPPADFSSTKNSHKNSFPSQRYNKSYNQQYDRFNNRSNTADKVRSDVVQVRPGSTSQQAPSRDFNVPEQYGTRHTSLYKKNQNKSAISYRDPKFVKFEDTSRIEKGTSSSHPPSYEMTSTDEIHKDTAVQRIMNEIDYEGYIRIWEPNELKRSAKFIFRKIFVRELKMELLRRVNEVLNGAASLPIRSIRLRYKNKYGLSDNDQLLTLIKNRTFEKFEEDIKSQTEQNPGKSTPEQMQELVIDPNRPAWFYELKRVPSIILLRVKQPKLRNKKKGLSNLKSVYFGEISYYQENKYMVDEGVTNDTLSSNVITNFMALKDNVLVMIPVCGPNLPQLQQLRDFLNPFKVLGMRRFNSKNIYLVLLENEEDCAKLCAMENTSIGGKVVKFLPIADATEICKRHVVQTGTINAVPKNKTGFKKNKNKFENRMGSIPVAKETKNVIGYEVGVFNSTKYIKTQAVTKKATVGTGSSKNVTVERKVTVKNIESVENGSNMISQKSNSEVARNLIVPKKDNNNSADKKMVDLVDTLPDNTLSDDELEINDDDLEDY